MGRCRKLCVDADWLRKAGCFCLDILHESRLYLVARLGDPAFESPGAAESWSSLVRVLRHSRCNTACARLQ